MPAHVGSHSNAHIEQMLRMMGDFVDTVTLQDILPNTRFYRVDKSGVDATGAPGRIDKPYLTVQAAVNAAAMGSGGIILIGAGIFAENVIIPSSITNLVMIGAGRDFTSIVPAAGIAVSYVGSVPATALTLCTIKDISLTGEAGAGLSIVGSLTDAGAGATALSSLLLLDGVRMSSSAGANAMIIDTANNVEMVSCLTPTADAVVFNTVSTVTMTKCTVGTITFQYLSATAVKPSGGCGAKRLNSCRFNGLGVTAIENVICDAACVCSAAMVVTCLDGTGTAVGTNGLFEFHGRATATMTLTHDCTVAPREAFICDECVVDGAFSMASVAIGAVNVCSADFRGSLLKVVGVGAISVGNASVLDLRGGSFDEASLVSVGITPGAINRTTTRPTLIALTGGATPDAIVFAVPLTDANYSVAFENTAVAEDMLITLKTAAGFTATAAGAGEVDASCIVLNT